jgi:hypothetical protein
MQHAVGEPGLVLHTGDPQDLQIRSTGDGIVEQRGFADTGLAPDDQASAEPGTRGVQRAPNRRPFGIPAVQLHGQMMADRVTTTRSRGVTITPLPRIL